MPDDCKPKADGDTEMAGGLQMSRAQMLDLGQKALELVVERTESLPGDNVPPPLTSHSAESSSPLFVGNLAGAGGHPIR